MKTGFFKKAAAVFMAGAMAVSLAGCADDSWSTKDDTQTLAAGVYIYNLYSAYQEAQSRVMMESQLRNQLRLHRLLFPADRRQECYPVDAG